MGIDSAQMVSVILLYSQKTMNAHARCCWDLAASIDEGQNSTLTHSTSRVRDSIVASISACHAEDPGSIPGLGDSAIYTPEEVRTMLDKQLESLPPESNWRPLDY